MCTVHSHKLLMYKMFTQKTSISKIATVQKRSTPETSTFNLNKII